MSRQRCEHLTAALLAGTVMTGFVTSATAAEWRTVVNNGDLIPGTEELFNSYSPPSVNASGLVAFRARSRGGQGRDTPVHGIFQRHLGATAPQSIRQITRNGGLVPSPNNTSATFNEFPAFPRIDATSAMIATRGQTTPVWEYPLPDGTETRIGTAGIFTNPTRSLITGASLLGAIPEYSYYQVPSAPEGTRFDQFPGAPSPANGRICFKGNFTEYGDGATGVFCRDVRRSGEEPVRLIARSGMDLPDQPGQFGSTAPPSAARGKVVFLGVDDEAAPTSGGLYVATIQPAPQLRPLVAIGSAVPGVPGATFARLGEALSFDGRYVGFWGTWGTTTHAVTLSCPEEGNRDRMDYCRGQYPNGFTTAVPSDQGLFVHDLITGRTHLAARAKGPEGFEDFLFWVFSGRVPGTGGSEEATEEPARWRSSAFIALSGQRAAFKAAKSDDLNGIYLRLPRAPSATPLLETGAPATLLDPAAPVGIPVTALGIERDGFRGCWLSLTASMAGTTDAGDAVSWAGIYITRR